MSKYDSIYDAMIDLAAGKNDVVNNLDISEKIQTVIQEIGSKIKLPTVEIRGIIELSNNKSDGVEVIRKILLDIIKENNDSKIEISYIGAPKYRLKIIAQDFKTAEKILKPIIEKIEKDMKKKNGVFNFTREESKKTGEG